MAKKPEGHGGPRFSGRRENAVAGAAGFLRFVKGWEEKIQIEKNICLCSKTTGIAWKKFVSVFEKKYGQENLAKNNFMLEIITPPSLLGHLLCILAVGTLLAVSNDKGGVALLPLTNWSTRRSSFLQDSTNAPSVTLKSFISSTSQRSSKNNRSNGKRPLTFILYTYLHITTYYLYRERERQFLLG